MTNKEWKIKNLRLSWGELLLKKETLLKDIWATEYKLNQIKEELLRYGVSEKIPRMDENTTEIDPMADLDRSFTYDGGSNLQ